MQWPLTPAACGCCCKTWGGVHVGKSGSGLQMYLVLAWPHRGRWAERGLQEKWWRLQRRKHPQVQRFHVWIVAEPSWKAPVVVQSVLPTDSGVRLVKLCRTFGSTRGGVIWITSLVGNIVILLALLGVKEPDWLFFSQVSPVTRKVCLSCLSFQQALSQMGC